VKSTDMAGAKKLLEEKEVPGAEQEEKGGDTRRVKT